MTVTWALWKGTQEQVLLGVRFNCACFWYFFYLFFVYFLTDRRKSEETQKKGGTRRRQKHLTGHFI